MLTRTAFAPSIETEISCGPSAAGCYFSELARDADLAELVQLFVEELPIRVAGMRRAASEQDWREVSRLAHQLKGAGGSHGFPQLTEAARHVERAAEEPGTGDQMAEALAGLEGVCERVRAGVPG